MSEKRKREPKRERTEESLIQAGAVDGDDESDESEKGDESKQGADATTRGHCRPHPCEEDRREREGKREEGRSEEDCHVTTVKIRSWIFYILKKKMF